MTQMLLIQKGEKMKKSIIAAGAASLAVAAMPVVGVFAEPAADGNSVTDVVEITIDPACGVSSDTTSAGVENELTATMTNSDEHEWDADGTGGELYVTCNDASGWNVTARGFSNNTAGTTTMVPTGSGTAIPTAAAPTGGTSAWAFKVADGDTGATIVSAYSTYAAVPSAATRVAYKDGTAVSEGLIYTGYKVATSDTQQADTYTGKVKYVISAGVGS